jgi:hypothetical protein
MSNRCSFLLSEFNKKMSPSLDLVDCEITPL